jgi:hypothetical protein
MFVETDRLDIPGVNKKNDIIWGQASWAKMTPIGGKLTALAYHPTKKVNKVELVTSPSKNIRHTVDWHHDTQHNDI